MRRATFIHLLQLEVGRDGEQLWLGKISVTSREVVSFSQA